MENKHWRVEISLENETILAIEPEMLAGAVMTDEYEEVIENCAAHLLSFLGKSISSPEE